LSGARADAELIYAGKEGGGESMPQESITQLLVDRGLSGASVVRLKGGDPFVFGRGGEEALALREAGVPFSVVPGVTAGVAGPAYAGIPITHRGAASAVAFVTGHEDPSKDESAIDWRALAAFPGTLVFYMGVRQLGAIAERLVAAGRNPGEPAAVVERGTLPDQRVVSGRLETIAATAVSEGVRAPALIVVGSVVALGEQLSWFSSEKWPLAGVAVAVTRARTQASALADRLRALGAEVVEAPAIRIVALDGPALSLAGYDLICLTSPNGVRLLFDRLFGAGLDARALAGVRVAAIGPGTAAALRSYGVVADVVPPERFVAEGLVEALADVPVTRALVARAAVARDVLVDALRERGAEVDVVALYETAAEPLSETQVAAVVAADYVTFTSSSTVRFLVAALGGAGLALSGRLVSIGPVTTATLRDHGLEPHVEAERHDIDGLIEALVADASARQLPASG
jgi:uroporphyrinogen III methyltransferase/synthase